MQQWTVKRTAGTLLIRSCFEVDVLLEKTAELIAAMADIDNSADLPVHHPFEEVEQMCSIGVIETVGWFIENEYFGHFDQRPGNEQQTLFAVAQTAERLFFQSAQAKHPEP